MENKLFILACSALFCALCSLKIDIYNNKDEDKTQTKINAHLYLNFCIFYI